MAWELFWPFPTPPGRRDALPEDSHEMSIFIRKVLSDHFGRDSSRVKIIYGGSAIERDAAEFLSRGGVDGLLMGRASLSAEKFSKIIKIAEKTK